MAFSCQVYSPAIFLNGDLMVFPWDIPWDKCWDCFGNPLPSYTSPQLDLLGKLLGLHVDCGGFSELVYLY